MCSHTFSPAFLVRTLITAPFIYFIIIFLPSSPIKFFLLLFLLLRCGLNASSIYGEVQATPGSPTKASVAQSARLSPQMDCLALFRLQKCRKLKTTASLRCFCKLVHAVTQVLRKPLERCKQSCIHYGWCCHTFDVGNRSLRCDCVGIRGICVCILG